MLNLLVKRIYKFKCVIMEGSSHFEKETVPFIQAVEVFFSDHTIVDRIDFLDNWVNPISIDDALLQKSEPSELFQFYEQLTMLLSRAETVFISHHKDIAFTEAIKMDVADLKKEMVLVNYQAKHLLKKEMANPRQAFVNIFFFYDETYYLHNYKDWLVATLAGNTDQDWDEYTYPIYINTKKMLETCWLIHERVISKNSTNSIDYHFDLAVFENTSPLLLNHVLDANPFEIVESFFNLDDLAGHKTYLKNWYRAALGKEDRVRNAADYFFIHNQFTQLLYVGYLIATRKLVYTAKDKQEELTHLLGVNKSNRIINGEYHAGQYEINTLPVRYVNNPYRFIELFFVPEKIKRLRLGLLEWLYAAFSTKNSIKLMDKEFLFEQYETMLMITEAFFLIITNPLSNPMPAMADEID